jgi:hypothetical protein
MTTTTDVELYGDAETEAEEEPGTEVAETEAPEPLSEKEAKALDKKIRAASDKLSTQTENLLDLLEQAASGSIHEALGMSSWTAWFKDAVQINVSDRFERKELAKMMSGKGMSQRAIAGSLGVSQKTIDRDLEGEEVEEGETVTGLDGAERPKSKTKAAPVEEDSTEGEGDGTDYIDAEVVEPPTPAVELVETFNDETTNLWGAVTELEELLKEPKWGGARKRVVNNNLNHIQEVITKLGVIVDDLMTGK